MCSANGINNKTLLGQQSQTNCTYCQTRQEPKQVNSVLSTVSSVCECCRRLGLCCVRRIDRHINKHLKGQRSSNVEVNYNTLDTTNSLTSDNCVTLTSSTSPVIMQSSSVSPGNAACCVSSSTSEPTDCSNTSSLEITRCWRTSRRRSFLRNSMLVQSLVFLLLVSYSDACSTRSTPKARSPYISGPMHQANVHSRPSSRIVNSHSSTPSLPNTRLPHHSQQMPHTQSQSTNVQAQVAKAPPIPTVSDAELGTTQRPNVTFQTYTCPEAYAKWYCLNGATCFSIKIGESILYNCECADGYMGQRCEFKDLDGTYLPRRGVLIETASIAGGLVIIVLAITLSCMIFYLVHLRTRFEKSEVKNGQYVYRSCNGVGINSFLTARLQHSSLNSNSKQPIIAVPVTVLTPEALVRTV